VCIDCKRVYVCARAALGEGAEHATCPRDVFDDGDIIIDFDFD